MAAAPSALAAAHDPEAFRREVTLPTVAGILHSMSLPPDDSLPPSPPTMSRISAEERRRRHEDRLKTIRLRMAIGRELDERGIVTPAAIGVALGMPGADAVKLLTRHRWQEGNVALLEAAAARLGVQVPEMPQLFSATRR